MNRTTKRFSQAGVTTVEFAIIGAVVLLVLFAVIEVGRTVFALNTLVETTRRTARIASVCPIGDPAIQEVAMLNAPGSGTVNRILRDFTPANIAVEYLNRTGNVIADPSGNFAQIYFVRARIVNYQHEMLIPFVATFLPVPAYATTVRRESLGIPRAGTVQAC